MCHPLLCGDLRFCKYAYLCMHMYVIWSLLTARGTRSGHNMVNYKLINVDCDGASVVQKNPYWWLFWQNVTHEQPSVTFFISFDSCRGKCQLSLTVLGNGSKFSDLFPFVLHNFLIYETCLENYGQQRNQRHEEIY